VRRTILGSWHPTTRTGSFFVRTRCTTSTGAVDVDATEVEEDADAASGSDVSAGLSSSDDEGSTI
jgi:hypothetical protein